MVRQPAADLVGDAHGRLRLDAIDAHGVAGERQREEGREPGFARQIAHRLARDGEKVGRIAPPAERVGARSEAVGRRDRILHHIGVTDHRA